MEKENESIFAKSTVIISLILTILSGIGLWLRPDNGLLIILIAGATIIVVAVIHKFNQIDINTEDIEFLRKYPGIGFVGSITLSALIDTPERFSTVKKIWIYCGYGLDRQSSSDKKGPPKITKRGNRFLKYVIMTAVHNNIQICKDGKYKKWYLDEIQKGTNPKICRAKIARKLIKDIWLEWRNFNEINLKKV